MTEKVDVTIRIETSESGHLREIVDKLKSRGLDRVESHERFMIVNGSVDSDGIDALREVEGVASVRKDRVYKAQ